MKKTETPEKSKHEILLVDDTPASLRLLTEILAKDGYRVRPALNGSLALRSVVLKKPDLILLDVKMPVMDGYEVCKRLKSDTATRDIPVIFISALGETSSKVKGFKAGAVDYITKPFEREEVLARVRTQLRLRELAEHLEQKVGERTEELTKANEQLRLEIAERKKTEAALQKAKLEAEIAARAKSEFLANMSHEIRTPMNGVIGMTELLMTTGLTPLQKDYAESIEWSANALLDLLNDILDFSKIKAGKLSIKPAPFNLRETVEQVGRLFASQGKEKGIEILVRYHPDASPHVVGDQIRIRQILTNLAGNAVKFTDRGHVLIEAVCEEKIEDRHRMLFSVSDTGPGIQKEFQEIVFDQFSQADKSATKVFGGTGLGLAISKQLVEMMGGTIGLDSTPGKGTTFFFRLEFQRTEEEDLLKKMAAGLSDVPVLVADDSENVRKIALEYLKHQGIPGDSAVSGDEALEKLLEARRKDRPFGIAVLDYRMPGISGGELAKAVKTSKEIGDTVLIFLSGSVTSGELDAETRSRFAAHMLKPLRMSQFLQTLSETWTEHRGSGPKPPAPDPFNNIGHIPPVSFDILMVEDNRINRRAATGILQRFGCSVDIAENGREAVERFQMKIYDMVFMDVHMPEMDGLEATRRIREYEAGQTAGTRPARVPIVAMTALAMAGDREKCIETGMDDYISKPIKSKLILDILTKYCGGGGEIAEKRERPETDRKDNGASQILNKSQLFDIGGRDPELVLELIEEFKKESPLLLEKLRVAVRSEDQDRICKTAHKFGGLVANLGGERLAEILFQIEKSARQESFDPDDPALKDAGTELSVLCRTLEENDWKSLCDSP